MRILGVRLCTHSPLPSVTPTPRFVPLLFIAMACSGTSRAPEPLGSTRSALRWDARAAATYLDARQTWWSTWPTATRDRGTSCVSCHTAVPYALARPALSAALHEARTTSAEDRLLDNVILRVRRWNEVEPFYPDQKNGLPKTSESRGTEAVLNALILATRDARTGSASEEGRIALANMWALQFRNGDMAGAWAWLNFHLEPWESSDATYFGATLAAIAAGTSPGGDAGPDAQERIKALRAYLTTHASTQPLFNRVTLLWASGRLPGVLTAPERAAIADAMWSRQLADGGWSLSALGQWKRSDNTALDSTSDGYATGLAIYALLQSGQSPHEPHVAKALAWLEQHQDRTTGMWVTASLNKKRPLTSDVGKFMSDAATAYAVLALTQAAAADR